MKKYFMKKAPKESTPEENRAYLQEIGVSTHKPTRERKFGGFSDYAKEVAQRNKKDYNQKDFAVSGANDLYDKQQAEIYGSGGNPYANARETKAANPYAQQQAAQPGNPYADNAFLNSAPTSNSYSQQAAAATSSSNPYANQGSSDSGANPYASASSNPYAANQASGSSQPTADPYTRSNTYAESTYAPSTYAPSNARDELFGNRQNSFGGGGPRRPSTTITGTAAQKEFDFGNDEELDELNGLPDQQNEELDELNDLPDRDGGSGRNPYAQKPQTMQFDDDAQQQQQQDQEDEEVEELRRQIRFTKKESLSSTQNTLRLAAEAEASGRNAIGMLGAQGERIANTERSLALAKNQSKVATQKSEELRRLNRSIFVPNVSNPFTSSRRLQEKEARIKSDYTQQKIASEHLRQQQFESEQRVLGGLNANGVSYSETAMKHKKEQMRNSEGRKKFQFEADSEDEDLEDEIELNLEGISNAAGRMKNLAMSMGDEVQSQNTRLERITRQTDELDVDVHLNAARLAAIK